ncbi:hypothetical protein GQ53DRAFT_469525 [Thozetella sp. PMI_491]|nr:hypothetical protein GQ53DRAFT_469525 [Thozetella sp. PMI_491]
MEKKRKLPARAAARVEHVSKKRNLTPEPRSLTPAPVAVPEPEPAPVEEPPPPLPKSVQAGKPLPTVESAQPEDLPAKDYQSIAESGVLAESLSRSRHKWISEGIFEKYWTKPSKRKGVVVEDNNPPKESMTKVGQVTITVEPHVFEATMYVVKDPKPPAPPQAPPQRPVLQYGPPNGVMPPPPAPTPTPAATPGPASAVSSPVPGAAQPQQGQKTPGSQTPVATPVQQQFPTQSQSQSQPQPQAQTPTQPVTPQEAQRPPSVPPVPAAVAGATALPRPMASPRGMESMLSPSTATPQPGVRPPALAQPQVNPQHSGSTRSPALPVATPAPSAPVATAAKPVATPLANPPARAPVNGTPTAAANKAPAPGTDPIILTLAEKAGEDPHLRELMRKVAQGDAAKHELERFQAIIDQITAESKRKGAAQGPSADRLLVDGKTVRYFADEVRAILDIVLLSNPKQTSVDLRPPAGSDPLVVLLVKNALDDVKTRDMVRRIAENKPQFSDATDLKAVLDRLKTKLAAQRQQTAQPATPRLQNLTNGHASPSPAGENSSQVTQPAQQSLRSKGPPPAPPKPDILTVVFEFSGGTGDRYSFPKFSILETVPLATGQQVIASFLIVRKGSASEYPAADPALDYYQPVTIRLYAPSGRHLENLFRVVAPEEEVRRYMDDIMDKMTRAEYILLAMRLPRNEAAIEEAKAADERETEKEKEKDKEALANGAGSNTEIRFVNRTVQPGVLWTTKAKPEIRELPPRSRLYGKGPDAEADDQYRSFIASVSKKEPKEP